MSEAQEYDGWDIPNWAGNEEAWKEGIHYDQNDKEYKLTEMTDSHLKATIRLFGTGGWDISPLKSEAYRRGL